MEKLFKDLQLWEKLQINHQNIIRWGTFLEGNSSLRKQNNLQHIVSFVHVATWICFELEEYIPFDTGLVLSAANIHEHGEAILKRDIVYDEKKNDISEDVLEYINVDKEFIRIFGKGSSLYKKMQKAFLLQFATKDENFINFPNEARNILKYLKDNFLIEAKIFNAIERYEYFYYCFESNSKHNKKILRNVLNNQKTYLDRYVKEIPGFYKIWTSDHSKMNIK